MSMKSFWSRGSDKKKGTGTEVSRFSSFTEGFKAKRLELIEPHLHWLDSDWINRSVEKHIEKAESKEKNPDPQRMQKFEKIMKRHFVNDIFSLFYNESKDMKLAVRNEKNDFRYKLIEKINKSGIKVISNRNTMNSALFTQEIAKFFYDLYKTLTPEQIEQLSKMMDGDGSGEGDPQGKGKGKGKGKADDGDEGEEGNSDSSNGRNAGTGDIPRGFEQMLENMMNTKQAEEKLEDAIRRAEERLKTLEESGMEVSESNAREVMDKMDFLDKSKHEITQLNISKDAILRATKHIMDKSTSYFSHRYITKEVDLYEAEDLLAMEGLEFLHPMFRKGRIMDITAKEKKYLGKYDLYVDNSGSMGCGANLPGAHNVSNMLLAKAIALRMKRMDLLNDLYEFQSSVTQLPSDEIGILGMSARGGTDITNVIRKIKQTKNNSVVLTDAEDHVAEYMDNVFFIGVGGVNFHCFQHSEAGKMYIERGQCVIFDGVNLNYPQLGGGRR